MGSVWTMGEILVEVMRPETDMPLEEVGSFLGPFPSGAPAIFIDTVARLGHRAGIIGGVGDDDFGRCVLNRLRTDGVCCDHVNVRPDGATAVAFVTYFGDGSRKFIFHIDGTPAVMADASGVEHVGPPEYFHVMGCSLMANDRFRLEIVKAVEYFADRGTQITFDPNIRPELLGDRRIGDVVGPVLRRCSVLFPGVRELQLLAGTEDIPEGVAHLFESPQMKTIVLKRGSAGCRVFTRANALDIPAYSVDEVDPTGAGDCFDAGFLCGMLEGRPLEECAKIASAAGALNAAAFGPMEGDISPAAIRKMIEA